MLLMNHLDSVCDTLLRIFKSDFKFIMAGMNVFELRRRPCRK